MKTLVLMVALTIIMHDGKKYIPDTDEDKFHCTEAEAEKLESIGAAKKVDDVMQQLLTNAGAALEDPLVKKTIEELKAIALERNVVIPEGVKLKADIVAFLNSVEGQGEA